MRHITKLQYGFGKYCIDNRKKKPVLEYVTCNNSKAGFLLCKMTTFRDVIANGFERTVAIWGTLTGTNATGQALCRMVDPNRKTTVLEVYF